MQPIMTSESESRKIYLGLDEGQRATRVVVLDASGSVMGTASGDPANVIRKTPEEIVRCWRSVIDAALVDAGCSDAELSAAGFGLSSLIWPSDRTALEQIVAKLRLPCRTTICDDCMIVLRAGLPEGIGIALLVGSGSGVIGRNPQGKVFRSFNSSRLGDGGGAWALTEEVMRWIACSYLGTAPDTGLTVRLLEAFGHPEVPCLLEDYVRRPIEYQRERVIRIIFDAYKKKDRAARSVVRSLVKVHGDNVVAVAKRLGLLEGGFTLVLSGGLFTAQTSPLVELVTLYLKKRSARVEFDVLKAWPAIGGAIAGMDDNTFEVSNIVRIHALLSGPWAKDVGGV